MRISRYYFFIVVLSLFPFIITFSNPLFPHTHDGTVHLARIAAYFKALQDGQIPVRWAGDLNYGYGMPLFNFIYPLPYWISSVLLFIGFGLITTFKLILLLSYLFSGVFMFAFAQAFFKDEKKAFLVAVFYQFAPFRLIELFIRGDIGEIYTYTFLPLVLLGLTLMFIKLTYRNFLLTSFATAFLIFSHNSVSLLFFSICVLFIIFFAKNKNKILQANSALFTGLLLSASYWLPAIFEHKFTFGDLFMKDLYLSYFPPLQNLFIPNITNNLILQIQGISPQIGLFHTLGIVLSTFVLFRKKADKIKRLIMFSIILLLISFFFMQPISKIIWQYLSFLRQFQFPWRFLSIVVFATSIISVVFINFSLFRKKLTYIIFIILVVFSTAWFWKPSLGLDKIDEKQYWHFPLTTTYFGETDIIWSAGPAKSFPKSRVEVIAGDAVVKNFFKKSSLHTYSVDVKRDARLVDHTQYFPGWKVYVDGKETPVQFQDENSRGEITFAVPKGQHLVKVAFGETKLRFFADMLSIVTLLILLLRPMYRGKI